MHRLFFLLQFTSICLLYLLRASLCICICICICFCTLHAMHACMACLCRRNPSQTNRLRSHRSSVLGGSGQGPSSLRVEMKRLPVSRGIKILIQCYLSCSVMFFVDESVILVLTCSQASSSGWGLVSFCQHHPQQARAPRA